MMRNLLTALVFVFIGFHAQAELLAQIDRNEVALGESVNLVISSDEQLAASPDFSVLEDNFQVSGPSQSQNFVMRNGQSYINLAWTVTLFPKKSGDLVIPSFEIDGKKTLPLLLKVSQAAQGANAQDDDIFVTAEINKPELYIGEQSIVRVKVFYSLNLLSGQLEEPQVDGAELQQLGEEKKYQSTQNGKSYQVIERNYLFYPSKSGEVTINPVSLLADLQQRNYRRKRVSRTSAPINVNVLAKPADYPANTLWLPSSALTLQEDWSATDNYQVGTPITRTLTLSAEGLAEEQLPELSQAPALTAIDNLKVYVDNNQTSASVTQQGLLTKQISKFAIIPETAGTITLPAYQLTWFNTTSKQVETITLPQRQINVAPLSDSPATTNPPTTPTIPTTTQNDSTTTQPNAPTNAKTTETTAEVDNGVVKELEKTVRFWQITSGVLALALCLAIAAAFGVFKRKSSLKPALTTRKSTTDFSHAYQLLASTNGKDKQLGLIEWWNLKYPQLTVSNLSQIAEQLDDTAIIAALNSLENSLYSDGGADNTNWLAWVKNSKIQPKITVTSGENKLKALY